jgi:NADPH2 dehydrogenase
MRCGGRRNVPGIWSTAQIAAWKEITEVVHRKNCFIFCQLWALGRAGHPDVVRGTGHRYQSASAVALNSSSETPEELTDTEIREIIKDYGVAARNAIEAGFDGVEIHGANGYLPDQFLQDTCNRRTDSWGGSVENRARFHLEVTRTVMEAVGAERTAIRLSPFSDFLGMLMDDPIPQFEYLVRELRTLKPVYLHLIEARIRGNDDADCGGTQNVGFLVRTWDNASPVFLAGGFTSDSAEKAVDETYAVYDVVIVFGRYFVSNPDLVFRVQHGVALTPYDRSVFYTPKLPRGYVDYQFSKEFVAGRGYEVSR